jgi:hypothetical protein
MADDAAQIESLAKDLDRRFPLDTLMQSLFLPAIQAQLALNRKNPALALSTLQAALPPVEYGFAFQSTTNFSCLYHTYFRGNAYLATGQRCRRVPEDSRPQRPRLELLDGSLGASGRGSCQRLAGENLAGIPILKEVKAEYARLW